MKNNRLKALLGAGTLALTLSATTTTHAASRYATTTANLNFRTGPSTNNKIIATIKKGSKVEVISKNGDWAKIKYNNKEGYSNTKYLKEEVTSNNANNSTSSTKTGVVLADTLNIRTGASTNYDVIAKANSGEKLTILSSSNGWYKVKLSNGKTGWASAKYIKVSTTTQGNTSNSTNTNNTTTTQKTGVVTADVLNVRSGASTSYSVVTKVNNGEKVAILDSDNGWYKVKVSSGKIGWVSSKYIKVSTTTQGNISNSTATQKTGVVIADVLNIRSGASTSHDVIAKANSGEKLTVLDSNNGWYKVKLSNGKIGWASAKYISLENTTTPSTKPDTQVPSVKPDSQTPPQTEQKPNYTINKVTTNYDLNMDDYAKLQNEKNPRYSVDEFKNYIDVNQRTNPLVFLRLDKYRDINVDLLNSKLVGEGVLQGQGANIAKAAKANNIDPVYLISQTIHETGHGKSTLASGVTITEIADESKPITDANGNITGYEMIPLDKPTTVYNLYGIGAKDNLPTMPNRALILGTTRAYNEGWTSVESAISGAASFVSNMYIHNSKYNQNTIYEFAFNPSKENIWHQYATDIGYADKVANIMSRFKDVYLGGEFIFDIPQFASTSGNSSRSIDFDINKVDDSHLSIGDISNY